MGGKVSTVEERLARLASKAHGVVTRVQLLRAGITTRQIEERVRSGALLREHRGVYRVGHRSPSTEARYMAAVRAGGDAALLSGRAAAYLLGVVKGKPPPPEVTVPTDRRIVGVKTRRSSQKDATLWRGIPVTTVPRTLVDIAPYLPQEELARACHEAGVRHHTTPAQVEAILSRRLNTPGAAKLRAVMRGDVHVSLSRLEEKFLSRLRAATLMLPPQTNRPAGTKRVDCRWPEQRLTVELDSYRFHNSRYAWEQDRHCERSSLGRSSRR